jgi:cytochrome c553
MNTHKVLAVTLGMALAFVAGGSVAANLEAGRAKAKEVCAACHGEDGNSTIPDYPKLSGQHRDYLEKALRDYKSGLRKNPIMAPMAAPLSNADIENLSAYFHAQKASLSTRQ